MITEWKKKTMLPRDNIHNRALLLGSCKSLAGRKRNIESV